jgi:hypothetical protein
MSNLYKYNLSGKFTDNSVLAKIKRINIIHFGVSITSKMSSLLNILSVFIFYLHMYIYIYHFSLTGSSQQSFQSFAS